jgi:membrane protease YdiL (CAAX protease family)
MARGRSRGKTHSNSAPVTRPPADTYWFQSARPLTSLVFVAPMLIGYELGVLWLGNRATRNGADVWLRGWLDWLGFGQYFLLPALTCGLLLAWHHTRRESWNLRWSVFGGMFCESAVLGLLLLQLAYWQHAWWASAWHAPAAAAQQGNQLTGRLIAYFGAGIYEELLFRLSLLPALILILRRLTLTPRQSAVVAVVLTSLLFAAVHYRLDFQWGPLHVVLPYGDAFEWSSFSFRFLAGSFFATLFVTRGFGIAVGAHALYDIFTILG